VIFGDKKKAIQMCINRFDNETKLSFMDLYQKVEIEVAEANTTPMSVPAKNVDDEVPF
jgi:hypothetical protein